MASLDERATLAEKFLALDEESLVLWHRALCYSARNWTCGFIATETVRTLWADGDAIAIAWRLVEARLWTFLADGYQVVDLDSARLPEALVTPRPVPPHVSEARRRAGKIGGLRSAERRALQRAAADELARLPRIPDLEVP